MIGSNHVPFKRTLLRPAWFGGALLAAIAWGSGFSSAQNNGGRLSAAEKAEKDSLALLLEARYPSATTCRTCHPEQYREWSLRFRVPCPPLAIGRETVKKWVGCDW